MLYIKEFVSKHLKRTHKAQLGLDAIEVAAAAFIVLGILLGIGAYILAQVKANVPGLTCNYPAAQPCDGGANSANQIATAANGIFGNSLSGINTFGIWMPILAVVIVASIVLGIVLLVLGRRGSGASV